MWFKHIFSAFLFTIISVSYSYVHELNDHDFDVRLKGASAMVMFHSPTCGHCKRLMPTYESLSSRPAVASSGVIISKVDCTDRGAKLCEKYGVRGFPTVKYISRREDTETIEDYQGNRQLEDLENFVLLNSRPAISEVEEGKVSDFIVSTTLPVVVGYFKDSSSKLYKKLLDLSKVNRKDFIFGYTFSKNAAEINKQTQDCVVLYRQQQYKSPYEDGVLAATSEPGLQEFLRENKRSLVEIREPKNEQDLSYPMITAFLPLDHNLQKSSFKRFRNYLVKKAKEFKDITFTVAQQDDFKSLVNDMAPTFGSQDILLVAYDSESDKYLCSEASSIDDHKAFETVLSKFVADFKKGGVLQKFIKSQPISTPDEGHVKTVVASNFNEIVNNDEKDVFIEFYAPWCGHCKNLAPIYEELAKMLKDESHLVIAKMDATSNDVPKQFTVEGFPTLYMAQAGKKSQPIQFNGPRNVAGMLEWLKSHVTHPIKYSGPVPTAKEDL